MHEPPRCPERGCPNHRDPVRNFFQRRGSYRTATLSYRVRRYVCKLCGKWFSDQTFRASRYDKKPHLNTRVLELTAAGCGYRQGARIVGLTRKSYTKKVRKMARNAALMDSGLQVRARRLAIARGESFSPRIQMDEFFSFEECRSTRPLAIATAIEADSRFQIHSWAASIRPKVRRNARHNRLIARQEAKYGPRVDESAEACTRVLEKVKSLFPRAATFLFQTDERSVYRTYLRDVFEEVHVQHESTPGSAPRGHGTPLFPINQTEAITRDHLSKLRRQSWLHPKRREHLQPRLALHRAIKNYVSARFNCDRESPAQILGFAPRRLQLRELYGWRQDWGQRSPCPFGNGERSLLALDNKGVKPGPKPRVSS